MTQPDNNKPFPVRLGNKKPQLQAIANEKKWSLHLLVNELLEVGKDCLTKKTNEFSYMEETVNELSKGYFAKKDELVLSLLKAFGVTEENISQYKDRLKCITRINDPYEHYYFTTDNDEQVRLISIHKPDFSQSGNKMTISSKYY